MDAHDNRFLTAIALGAVVGIPVLWAAMTVIFMVVTDQDFTSVAGYSALPAFFCGPFLGGLFTTAMVNAHEEDEPVEVAEAPNEPAVPRAA
jgi:hypothetical protein